MERPFVEWVRVENYRCIRQADLHLTPLHALIGPNDSGKSSLLRAISQQAGTWWVKAMRGGRARFAPTESFRYFAGDYPHRLPDPEVQRDAIQRATEPVTLLRLDPDELRRACRLIPKGKVLWFQNERGLGLPALYDALQTRDLDAFIRVRDRFARLFPTVKSLRLENPSDDQKALGITLRDGTEVSATEMSEGMLYWLAFAVIAELKRHALLLIEEPENGLHPARIAEVMRVLRELSQTTQVILATHSPLVINELQPDEVTIVTRTPERGTICTPMTATKNFAMRSRTYSLGELWLSYADGDLEKELVGEPDTTAQAG